MALPKNKSLSKEQKTGFILLLIFGFLTVFLGFFQIRNNIYGPFRSEHLAIKNSPQYIDENMKLQMIDTDQDGLSDYDEMVFYGTSRYLPDTDSDGIDDKTEIEQGTDPLCHEDKICGASEYIASTTGTVGISPLADNEYGALNFLTGGNEVPSDENGVIDLNAILNDPQKIRDLLIQSGQIDPAVLAEIDDETLLMLARESVSTQAE